MEYLIQDIIHGIMYKNSDGYKYEIIANLTGIYLTPFDLFCKEVHNKIDNSADAILSIKNNSIEIYISDINKTIII